MKKVALLLTLIFLFSGITDAQMMYQPKTSNLSSISGFTVDDDIDYMKKRRKKRRKSSRRGSDVQNVIKLNPLGFIWGNLLFYERVLSENITVQLGLGYYGNKTEAVFFGMGTEYKYTGINVSPSVRYYFQGEAPMGFYGGAGLNYLNRNEKVTYFQTGLDDEVYNNKITGFGGGLVFGYQWLFGSITLDLNGGAAYTSYNYKYDPDYAASGVTGGIAFSGILPAFGASVGFAF